MAPKKRSGTINPTAQPIERSEYCPSAPNSFLGPMVPQRIEAMKKVVTFGQDIPKGALLVHTFGIWVI